MRGADDVRDRADASTVAALSAVGLLAGIGAVAVFSATAPLADATFSPYFVRHATGLAIGAGVLLAAARVPLVAWYRLAYPLYGVALAALLATLVLGHVAGGARRWLVFPGDVRFQPVELVKLATVLATAAYLARHEARGELSLGTCLVALGFAILPAGVCLGQPDLGSAVVLLALSGLVIFVAGAPLRLLVGPGAALIAGVAAYCVGNSYARNRILAFLNPWEDPTGVGFQLVQSFVAFGRGGLLGTGVGSGLQKLHYLPEAHTDFILSVIAEESGLLGVLFVLGCFAALVVAGLRIAQAARQRFGLLLGFGLTAFLALPAVLNAAVVMGCLPPKGLTLPFVSWGRSSLLVSCLAAGMLVAIARAEAPPRRGSRGA
jgi:cell division protein FtsW